jgi:hypothetical protein
MTLTRLDRIETVNKHGCRKGGRFVWGPSQSLASAMSIRSEPGPALVTGSTAAAVCVLLVRVDADDDHRQRIPF